MNQEIKIVLNGQIPVFVTKVIGIAILVFVGVCKVSKVKALINQFAFMHTGLSFGGHFFDDAAVAAQDVIDVAHVVGGIGIQLIVVGVTAKIRAELFIGPAFNGFAAFGTVSFSAHFFVIMCL